MTRYSLAICTLFRNEARDLEEWIGFHRARGVEHFFLYDHESDDGSSQLLAPYVDAGLVTLERWVVPLDQHAQTRAFRDCLDRRGEGARWIAFIDVDEFLFCPSDPDGSIVKVLEDYREHPGVVVHWQCYGSSGHSKRSTGRVLDDFTHRAETRWFRNAKVKSIVDPARTDRPMGPHFFRYLDDARAVDERHRPVEPTRRSTWLRAFGRWVLEIWPGIGAREAFPVDPYSTWCKSRRTISANRLRINHYVVKSREAFTAKRARGDQSKYDETFFRVHDRNDVFDPILASRDHAPD